MGNPAWPGRAVVLAGYYSDGAGIPGEIAVVVEYTGDKAGDGRIVVVGDGVDPGDWGRPQPGLRRELRQVHSEPGGLLLAGREVTRAGRLPAN